MFIIKVPKTLLQIICKSIQKFKDIVKSIIGLVEVLSMNGLTHSN